jgi:hypothetical protein
MPNLPASELEDGIKYSKSLPGQQKSEDKKEGIGKGFYFFSFKSYFKFSRSFKRPTAFFILTF